MSSPRRPGRGESPDVRAGMRWVDVLVAVLRSVLAGGWGRSPSVRSWMIRAGLRRVPR